MLEVGEKNVGGAGGGGRVSFIIGFAIAEPFISGLTESSSPNEESSNCVKLLSFSFDAGEKFDVSLLFSLVFECDNGLLVKEEGVVVVYAEEVTEEKACSFFCMMFLESCWP